MSEEKVLSGSKHLDLDDRKTIESMLDKGMKLNEIAKTLNRDPRGLAKEIRRNRSSKVNRRFLFSQQNIKTKLVAN